MKEIRDYQRLDKPFSVRVPKELHKKYKSLSGFERKQIQYKIVMSFKRLLK